MKDKSWTLISAELVNTKNDDSVNLCFAVTANDEKVLKESVQEFLSIDELIRFKAFTSERRVLSFLRGRFAAKTALNSLSGVKLSSLHIKPGVFGQPVVQCLTKQSLPLHISLSHIDKGAVAVASSKIYPLALDLECISERNTEAMASQMTEIEMEWVNSLDQLPVVSVLTLLWTAKEAMSKILCAGLAVDFKLLALKDLKLDALNVRLTAKFEYFSHVKVEAVQDGVQAFAVVYPAITRFAQSSLLLKILDALGQAQNVKQLT